MFGVSADLLLMFYNSVISSTISFGAACWGGDVSQHDQGRVDKVIHRASRIVGRHLDNFQSLYRGKVLHKASQTLQDPSHLLHVEFIHGSVTEAADFYSLTSRQTATVLCCVVLCCTVLYCTVLYCTVLYCTVLYCTVLYCTVLYCTVLYCTVLYCTVLYCTVLYCTVLYFIALHCIALHCIALHCTALHCTALHCIALHCIALHCIALYCMFPISLCGIFHFL